MAERRLPAVLVSIVALGAFAFVAIGLLFANSLPGRLLTGGGFRPGPRQPPGGPAVVDGHQTEWTLVDELFTDVHRGGEESEKVEAQLYLRYDCRTNLMYALFLSAGEWPIMLRRSQVRVALDSASEELPIVEFAWMEPGYDGNSQHARGWEASFAVNPGEHLLWVAALAMDEGEVEEANTPNAGLPVLLTCNHPTTLFLKRLQALPSSGRIRLE
jgi:hypothetical protein